MPSTRHSNFLEVDGPWNFNKFLVRRIIPEDYSKVLEHVKQYFIKEEPTCVLLGFDNKFADQLLKVVQFIMLKDNLSLLAEDSETKEISAVRITFCQGQNTNFHTFMPEIEMTWKTDVFLNSIDITEEQKLSIFQQFGISQYAELFITATSPKYRNQGLSMELYTRSLTFLKAKGFKLVKCIFTNPTTRKSGVKLGFNEFYKIDYRSLKDKNGSYVFTKDKLLNQEHFAVISLKLL